VTVFPGNAAAGLPTHLATIILLDPDTGALWPSSTAATSPRRARRRSRRCRRASSRARRSTLGIIGSGVQARSHLEALGRVRSLTRVRVWSPNGDRLAAFVREMRHRTPAALEPALSAREAVEGADIVVLARRRASR
jgi:alanine dehydrogenase